MNQHWKIQPINLSVSVGDILVKNTSLWQGLLNLSWEVLPAIPGPDRGKERDFIAEHSWWSGKNYIIFWWDDTYKPGISGEAFLDEKVICIYPYGSLRLVPLWKVLAHELAHVYTQKKFHCWTFPWSCLLSFFYGFWFNLEPIDLLCFSHRENLSKVLAEQPIPLTG